MLGKWNFTGIASDWLIPVAVLIGAALLGWVCAWILFYLVGRVANRRPKSMAASVARHLRMPVMWTLPLSALLAAIPDLPLSPAALGSVVHIIVLLLIACAAWIVIRLIDAVGDVLAVRYTVNVADNLRARKIQTQFKVLRSIGAVLIMLIALGLMLVTFPGIRAVGAAVFASAGAAGIVLGLAARPVLTNLLAGVQIALAQPIRLEDAVVVEGEWGWIEEINMTYVVVRLWDLRRLILPLSYFIENPFQNWTRTTADLLGTAFIYADYTVPIQAVRDELHRILRASELWDGKAWSLDVTNLTERVVEMRAMVSAASAGNIVNLRRLVREKLVTFLQQQYPQCLPRTRVSVEAASIPAGFRRAPEDSSRRD